MKPPPELTAEERAIFAATVGSHEAEHFRASDVPMLSAYCRSAALEKRSGIELAKEPLSANGQVSGWAVIHGHAVKDMLGLALKLRISPQARAKTSTKAEPKLSYYERMALLEPEPDDPTPS
jgi:hypothetical protein